MQNQWLKVEQDVRHLRERISILQETVQKLSSRLVKAGEVQQVACGISIAEICFYRKSPRSTGCHNLH